MKMLTTLQDAKFFSMIQVLGECEIFPAIIREKACYCVFQKL